MHIGTIAEMFFLRFFMRKHVTFYDFIQWIIVLTDDVTKLSNEKV